MAPPEKSLHCSYCAKPFGRTEHLKRHELIHANSPRFACSVCPKNFMRRDALQRHEITHQVQAPSLLSKGARACIQCAAAKARCSGELQCSRCQQRRQDCTYPDANASAADHSEDIGHGNSTAWNAPAASVFGHSPIANFQHRDFNALQTNAPLSYHSTDLSTDFWDPSILSTTNWLDAIDVEFPVLPGDLGFDTQTSVYAANSNNESQLWASQSLQQQHLPSSNTQVRNRIQSPAIATSTGASAVSTESPAEVCASQVESQSRAGEYYVDGEPARLPRTKRRRLSKHSNLSNQPNTPSIFSLRIPLASDVDWKHRVEIPNSTYDVFFRTWQHTCLSGMFPWPLFEDAQFPSKDFFEHLLGLYFAHFHAILPFIHPKSFASSETHWLLILAMVAIGSQYMNEDDGRNMALSLQEFLRRCLVYLREDPGSDRPDELMMAQVRLLHTVGMAYSGDALLTRNGLDMQQSLVVSFSLAFGMHIALSSSLESSSRKDEVEWIAWTQREALRRTAYCIWVVDCMLAYQFQRRPLLGLDDATIPLPCAEVLWNATEIDEWETLLSNQSPSPTLRDALQELYVDKRLPRDRGEFARIIIVHGLYHRTWEVESYFSNPLSQWEPSAKKQSSVEVLSSSPIWTPSIPTFVKWQNSVCDCIDILHWQANATIGQNSGLEHHTVGHLHLARVVLLSPINRIVSLARAMMTPNGKDAPTYLEDRRAIQLWAVQGQYKARLAAIHAGVVFWHFRRYSIDGFYEAPAVALAALMLWAFGTFSAKQNALSSASANRRSRARPSEAERTESQDEASDDSACGIILLDRPTDDELVQQFVRRGQTMRAHITNVGDLYGAHGPERVLSEGCKLLGMLKVWGVHASWFDLLQRLMDVCKNERNAGTASNEFVTALAMKSANFEKRSPGYLGRKICGPAFVFREDMEKLTTEQVNIIHDYISERLPKLVNFSLCQYEMFEEDRMKELGFVLESEKGRLSEGAMKKHLRDTGNYEIMKGCMATHLQQWSGRQSEKAGSKYAQKKERKPGLEQARKEEQKCSKQARRAEQKSNKQKSNEQGRNGCVVQ